MELDPIETPSSSKSVEILASNDIEPIFVDELAPYSFAVFDEKDIQTLRERYRIIGDPFDRPGDANSTVIPLLLMSEQVQVLYEQDFIRIRRIKPFVDDVDFEVLAPKNDNHIDESKLFKRAKLMVKGRKIKELKRKSLGDEASSTQKRVKRNEIDYEDVETTDEELRLAIKELSEKEKLLKKNLEDESIAVSINANENAYELVQNVEFPNDPDYRRRVTVFRDLWRKGFYLSPGTRFGCHFLAYEKPRGEVHSRYMVICVGSTEKIPSLDLISVSRVATQVKKEVLLAVVAPDSVIPYYTKIGWWKGDC